ncbi:MAG TPA: ABC transporter ATP-binding protein [Phycisphaerales bacterium]|nr:ABC transporter ATP-binding protein [Phycisphaerales bacterium]HMP37926.1 ABC transporter ATP-binding protein [Phycisphaerales bacterium]
MIAERGGQERPSAARPGGVAIVARDLSKSFSVYQRPRDMLIELVTRRPRHRLFEALDGVSFEVRRGEVLGVMGRNGAGKSTLLKLVAGTLEPTRGSVEVDGRVAAILELGTGFHPQFTGRENVLMGGMCLGMTEREVRRKFDAIVDFAEIREFIDQPFRTYSTGMQTRLSFATAVAVDPQVLIVDEALSVGDARFQLKCHDRFRDFRRDGRTILLVSHSSEQVTAICDRAILLEHGRLVEEGDAAEVTRRYHRRLFGGAAPGSAAAPGADGELDAAAATPSAPGGAEELDAGTRMGNGEARIETISVSDLRDRDGEVRRLEPGVAYRVRFAAVDRVGHERLTAGVLLRDRTGQTIFGLDTRLDADSFFAAAAGERFVAEFSFTCHLGPGEYFLSFGLALPDGTKLDFCYDAVALVVGRRPGVYHASRADLDASIRIVRPSRDIPAAP